jgi:hypothetical protein
LRSTTMVETTQASKDATVIEKPAWDRNYRAHRSLSMMSDS